MSKRILFALLFAMAAFAQPDPHDVPGLQVQVQAPGPRGLPQAIYAGFGCAGGTNCASVPTALTTGNISINPTYSGDDIVVIGCSGNFATSTWSAAVTDSASNTYLQLGANTGTYPQANSTTQVCIPFIAPNAKAASSVKFTISGASATATTLAVFAWDVVNAVPTLAAVDHWSYGTGSSSTALSVVPVMSGHSNELVIAAGCASTGTITLATNSALNFDTGSQAITSGTNLASCYGGSALLGDPAGVTGSFTDGSSAAYSEVALILSGFALTDAGQQHTRGNDAFTAGVSQNFNQSPVPTSAPIGKIKANSPGSAATASQSIAGVQGVVTMLTGFGFCAVGNASLAAAFTQTVTLTSNSTTYWVGNASVPAAAGSTGTCMNFGPLAIPDSNFQGWSLAFGGNLTNVLENVWLSTYQVDVPNIVY